MQLPCAPRPSLALPLLAKHTTLFGELASTSNDVMSNGPLSCVAFALRGAFVASLSLNCSCVPLPRSHTTAQLTFHLPEPFMEPESLKNCESTATAAENHPSVANVNNSNNNTKSAPTSPTSQAASSLRARKGLKPLTIAATASSSVLIEQDSRDDTWTEAQKNVLFESASRLRLLSTSSDESLDAAEELERHARLVAVE